MRCSREEKRYQQNARRQPEVFCLIDHWPFFSPVSLCIVTSPFPPLSCSHINHTRTETYSYKHGQVWQTSMIFVRFNKIDREKRSLTYSVGSRDAQPSATNLILSSRYTKNRTIAFVLIFSLSRTVCASCEYLICMCDVWVSAVFRGSFPKTFPLLTSNERMFFVRL